MPTRRGALLAGGLLLMGASGRGRGEQPPKDGTAQTEVPTGRQSLVQPPLEKWAEVRVGTSRAEVRRLLGEPLRVESPAVWDVGELRFGEGDSAEVYPFSLLFQDDLVFQKDDPFGGVYEPNGAPSVPEPVYPSKSVTYDHYPRYVELRWQPPSGVYPMVFEMEWASLNGGFAGEVLDENSGEWIFLQRIESSRPGSRIQFVGATGGRWRVRARNEKGTSDWSAYAYFRFLR